MIGWRDGGMKGWAEGQMKDGGRGTNAVEGPSETTGAAALSVPHLHPL